MINYYADFKKSFLVALCLIWATAAFATNYSSNATGNWSNPSSWFPVGVPTAGDNVTILGNLTITNDVPQNIAGTLTIASLTMSSGSIVGVNPLTISGNTTLNGGTLALEAAVAIVGNLSWNFGTIGISTSPSVTTVTIGGVATMDGNITKSLIKRRLLFNSGGTWTLGSINVSDGGILEIPAGQTLNYNSTGGYNLSDGGGSGNLFDLKGSITIQTSQLTVGVPINNTGAINLSGGSLVVNGTYSGNGSISVSATRQFTIGNASGLNYGSATLTNNGAILSNALIFNGSVQQSLTGTGTIASLTINNVNGLIVSGAQTITTVLTLTNGNLQLNTNDLSLGTATLMGGSASSYIQTISTGNLKRTVSTTNVLFPVGESNYTPVTLKQVSGTDTYAVRVSDGIDVTHPLNGTEYINKEWDISRTPANVTAAIIKLDWNSPTDEGTGFVLASAQMLHHNGTNWQSLPIANRTTATGSLTQTNVTSFSPFAVGLPNFVLSVELLDFQVLAKKNSNELTWQTALEEGAAHFDIERSNDGKTFEKIGETKAKGTSSSYEYSDIPPLSTTTYYRLKMVDTDGKFTYSKIKSVSKNQGFSVKAFPNPVRQQLTIDAISDAKQLDFEIVDMLGRTVFQQNSDGDKSLTINTVNWQSGIYFLKVTDGERVHQQKIVKQ